MERKSGYRPNHSCETTLNLIIDEWKVSLSKNKVVIDFKRAFETIDRDILLKKLYYVGIRGVSLDLFRSYLESKTQSKSKNRWTLIRTKANWYRNPARLSTRRTPVFILYINDIEKVPLHCAISLLADDTLITIAADTYEEAIDKVNKDLQRLYHWHCMNKLTLNIQKTKWICFKSTRYITNSTQENISINGTPIERVDKTKNLGVIIDK